MGRLSWIGIASAVRYERSRSGEFVHEVKRLGRIVGGAGKRRRALGDQCLPKGGRDGLCSRVRLEPIHRFANMGAHRFR